MSSRVAEGYVNKGCGSFHRGQPKSGWYLTLAHPP